MGALGAVVRNFKRFTNRFERGVGDYLLFRFKFEKMDLALGPRVNPMESERVNDCEEFWPYLGRASA